LTENPHIFLPNTALLITEAWRSRQIRVICCIMVMLSVPVGTLLRQIHNRLYLNSDMVCNIWQSCACALFLLFLMDDIYCVQVYYYLILVANVCHSFKNVHGIIPRQYGCIKSTVGSISRSFKYICARLSHLAL
jgi:hypothetical protein